MRKILLCCALVLTAVPLAHASNVGVSVGVNIGGPPPAYVYPPVVIDRPPVFLRPPALGFYVAAGVGYDMFYLGNRYYLNSGSAWYASQYYNGPWVTINYNTIPYEIRRHPIKQVHYYRDVHYRKYNNKKARYQYRHFQPRYRDSRVEKGHYDARGGKPGHGGKPNNGKGHGYGPR